MKQSRGRIELYSCVEAPAFLRATMDEWTRLGWTTMQRFSITEAEYYGRKSMLQRLIMRIKMYVVYPCVAAYHMISGGSAVRVITTNPFYLPLMGILFSGGKCSNIALIYDIYPDALAIGGRVKRSTLIWMIGAAIARSVMRGSDAVVFIGDRMAAHVQRSYGAARHAYVIPVGADCSAFRDIRRGALGKRIVVLYAGQMGVFHDGDTIAGACKAGLPDRVEVWIYGRGRKFEDIAQKLEKMPRVRVVAGIGGQDWHALMVESSVALVTISPDASNVVFPSKVFSALAAGHAIIAICERATDLADLVSRYDVGWVVAPGDCVGLNNVLRSIADCPDILLQKQERAIWAAREFFDAKIVAERWGRIFCERPDIVTGAYI